MKYVSVLIATLNRTECIENIVNEIHKYADFPFELLVFDGSNVEIQNQNANILKDRVSILITSSMRRTYSDAMEILTLLASSNYLFVLTDDTFIRDDKPFGLVIRALDEPFVGLVNLTEPHAAKGSDFVKDDLRLSFSPSIDTGVFAVRKDVWYKAGGMKNCRYTSCFGARVIEKGFFIVKLCLPKASVKFGLHHVPSTVGTVPLLPKVFGFSKNEDENCAHALAAQEREQKWKHEKERDKHFRGLCNRLVTDDGINWEVRKKWRKEIEKYQYA